MNDHAQIFRECIASLRDNPDLLVSETSPGGHPNTGDIAIVLKDRPEVRLRLELRATSGGAHLPLRQRKNEELRVVHCHRYVNRRQALEFRQQDRLFIDTAGNMYVHGRGVYLWSSGNTRTAKNGRTARVFQTAGLKLIWAVLNKPFLLNATVREIATEARIAHGQISEQLKGLEELGFVRSIRKGRRALAQAPSLLERWVQGYAERLRPKLLIGEYRLTGELADLPARLRQWPMGPGLFIGGELAAAMRHPLLISPGTATIHSSAGNVEWLDLLHDHLKVAPARTSPNLFLVKPLGQGQRVGDGADVWLADPVQTLGELALHRSQRLDELKTALMNDILARLEHGDA